jgi:putative DNA methylase
LCKELAFLLFTVAEGRKQTQVAVDFNALGTAWNEIAAGAPAAAMQPTQQAINFEGD